MLLVLRPRNGLLVQQVSDGGNISRGLVEVIIVHAKSVTTNCREVVGLGRVSEGIELGPGVLVSGADRVDPVRCYHLQQDTLRRQPLLVGVGHRVLVILDAC